MRGVPTGTAEVSVHEPSQTHRVTVLAKGVEAAPQ